MFRALASLFLVALLLWSCGPDDVRTCSGQDPNFQIVLKLMARPLPADIAVHVTYAGSGMEEFRLSEPNARHKVAFCEIADQYGVPLTPSEPTTSGAAGAAGATGNSEQVVASLFCRLWTAGFTELRVSGTGFATMDYDLSPKEGKCVVTRELVLDDPDAGS